MCPLNISLSLPPSLSLSLSDRLNDMQTVTQANIQTSRLAVSFTLRVLTVRDKNGVNVGFKIKIWKWEVCVQYTLKAILRKLLLSCCRGIKSVPNNHQRRLMADMLTIPPDIQRS